MSGSQISKSIEEIKKELKELKAISSKNTEPLPENAAVATIVKQLVDERERTNRLLGDVTMRIKKLEEVVGKLETEPSQEDYAFANSKEVPLSGVDAKVIGFVQTKGMACAEELQQFMHYRGKNAACTRLNMLYKQGLLSRFQLGHKVYYRYDAGKANQNLNLLIVSPPQ